MGYKMCSLFLWPPRRQPGPTWNAGGKQVMMSQEVEPGEATSEEILERTNSSVDGGNPFLWSYCVLPAGGAGSCLCWENALIIASGYSCWQ